MILSVKSSSVIPGPDPDRFEVERDDAVVTGFHRPNLVLRASPTPEAEGTDNPSLQINIHE